MKKRMKTTMNKIRKLLLACGLASLLFDSCNPGDNYNMPIETPLASVNYTMVSETLPYIYEGNQNSGIGIYVDTAKYDTSPYSSQKAVPFIPIQKGSGTESSFPSVFLNASPYYLDYRTGKHSYTVAYVSDVLKTATSLIRFNYELEAGKHYFCYLADAPVQDGDTAAYVPVWVEQPLEKAVQQQSVAVNVVNLSNDAGALKIKLQKTEVDGSITEQGLGFSQQLAFGQSTGYQAVDTAYARSGMLALAVYDTQNTLLALTGVPASAGHSFELVTEGYLHDQTKKVPSGVLQGKLAYSSVKIAANFRIYLRQTY